MLAVGVGEHRRGPVGEAVGKAEPKNVGIIGVGGKMQVLKRKEVVA